LSCKRINARGDQGYNSMAHITKNITYRPLEEKKRRKNNKKNVSLSLNFDVRSILTMKFSAPN